MSLSNILVPNNYTISVGSLSIAKNETIAGNLSVGGTLGVTGNATLGSNLVVVADAAVGGDLTVTGDVLVDNGGVYFGNQQSANLLSLYNYVSYQTLPTAGNIAASYEPIVSYCRIGNMVTVSFMTSRPNTAYMLAAGACSFTWVSLGTVGVNIQADLAKFPSPNNQLQFCCKVNDGGTYGAGFIEIVIGTGIDITALANAPIAANDQIFNFTFSYLVNY